MLVPMIGTMMWSKELGKESLTNWEGFEPVLDYPTKRNPNKLRVPASKVTKKYWVGRSRMIPTRNKDGLDPADLFDLQHYKWLLEHH